MDSLVVRWLDSRIVIMNRLLNNKVIRQYDNKTIGQFDNETNQKGGD